MLQSPVMIFSFRDRLTWLLLFVTNLNWCICPTWTALEIIIFIILYLFTCFFLLGLQLLLLKFCGSAIFWKRQTFSSSPFAPGNVLRLLKRNCKCVFLTTNKSQTVYRNQSPQKIRNLESRFPFEWINILQPYIPGLTKKNRISLQN